MRIFIYVPDYIYLKSALQSKQRKYLIFFVLHSVKH